MIYRVELTFFLFSNYLLRFLSNKNRNWDFTLSTTIYCVQFVFRNSLKSLFAKHKCSSVKPTGEPPQSGRASSLGSAERITSFIIRREYERARR